MNKHVILLRHGETGFPGKYIGSSDVNLSSEGEGQIAALTEMFQDITIDLLLASPMARCRQSAAIALPEKSAHYDDDLREIDFGRWEGLSFAEIEKSDPELVSQWAEWSPEFCFPEGEQISNFICRINTVGKRIEEGSEKTVFVVAHGGVIRALVCYFLRLTPENFLLFQIEKGKFATINLFSEGGVLTGFNMGAKWGK